MDNLIRYKVFYEAKYEYEDVVTSNDNTLRITPYNGDNQKVIFEKVYSEPRGYLFSFKDIFGNTVYRIKVIEPHYSLTLGSESEVEINIQELENCSIPCKIYDPVFLNSSRLIDVDYFRGIAKEILKSSKDLDDLVKHTVSFVKNKIKYKEGITNVNTSAKESFEIGYGVCQDLAQITIGILRAAGIPARYVMGVVNDNPKTTHAWVEFKSKSGWIPIDPTRNRFYDIKYVKFAIGRDYYDTPPVIGTFVSSGKGWLKQINIKVEKVDY
ncbi:transglutaminase family protein [Acidianus sulfidivorans JP7]|uniref:Transglutaminase family protein n=1 Tax=Acidianus sulfidivorans JP7 TaxID=619593 RepID=A0A2U9IL40_9CREN|nr:transglutaminase family protein [Acidianus sulfidivorans]AWR96733.1 transglutaminase family protein [Acidianus sulfidivorans JP7]